MAKPRGFLWGSKVNASFTPSNETDNETKDNTNTAFDFGFGLPDKLFDDAARPVAAGTTICIISAILSALMIVVLSKRLRQEYGLLQNVFVADLVTVLLTSPLWLIGMLFDPFGLALPEICRIEGFLVTSLQTVFLWTVTAIAISQLLCVLAPDSYGKLVSTPLARGLFLLSLWTGSGLLCAAPLNSGIQFFWGMYGQLGHSCWMAWKRDSSGVLSFAVFHTVLTLVPAILSSGLALAFVHFKNNNAIRPDDNKNARGEPRPRPEVLYITSAMLLIFLAFWLPLTVIQPHFLRKKLDKARRQEAFILLYFMFGRGILNFFVAMAISGRLRGAFVDIICKCRCSTSGSGENVEGEGHVENGH